MTPHQRDAATQLLLDAWRTGAPLSALPDEVAPSDEAQALAIQERLVAISGEQVAGWKVATSPEGVVMYGTIFAADVYTSTARVDRTRYRLMGIEGEIAFRFTADLPRGNDEVSREQLLKVTEPIPAIEIVNTRFESYTDTPMIHRLADRMSNGGLVFGTGPDRAPDDLSQLEVSQSIDDAVMTHTGGHMRGDPVLPALEFVIDQHPFRDFAQGHIITAGTFTGLEYYPDAKNIEIGFKGVGSVRVELS